LAVIGTNNKCNEKESTDDAYVLGFGEGIIILGEILFAIAPAMASARIIVNVEEASIYCIEKVMGMMYIGVSAYLKMDPKSVSKFGHYTIARWQVCAEFLKEIGQK
jgi:hypothetical protein